MQSDIDDKDRELLTVLGRGFPLHPHPFREIAQDLSMTESEVMERIGALMEDGKISRIGAIIDPRKMGFTSTLVSMRVPEDQLDGVVEHLNQHPGVTHNYLRDHEYNLWFTIIAPDRDEISRILKGVEERFGLGPVELPMSKRFKIGVKLDIR